MVSRTVAEDDPGGLLVTDDIDDELATRVLSQLPLDIGDEVVEKCLREANQLESSLDELSAATGWDQEIDGQFVDDEYDALLDVYDEPRQVTDTPRSPSSILLRSVVTARRWSCILFL